MGKYDNYKKGRYSERKERRGVNREEKKDHDKKSGATYTKIKKGKNEGLYCVSAWRKTKFGLMTASAFPAGNEEYQSQAGNTFRRYAVEVSNRDAGTHQTYWCLMNMATQMIFIKDLGFVISPNGRGYTSSGVRVEGYFGKI